MTAQELALLTLFTTVIAALVNGLILQYQKSSFETKLNNQKTENDAKMEAQRRQFEAQMAAWQAERTRELESVKLEHNRGLKVHALQYEKEFTTYQALWTNVYQTFIRASEYWTAYTEYHEGKQMEGHELVSHLDGKYMGLVNAFNDTKSPAWKNFPFIPHEIEEDCTRFVESMHDFIFTAQNAWANAKNDGVISEEVKAQTFHRLTELKKNAEKLKNSIRQKVGLTSSPPLDLRPLSVRAVDIVHYDRPLQKLEKP